MHSILSTGLWVKIRAKAAKARRRQAAIAYVTADLVGFKKGDVLVVDASPAVIKFGETDAKLLRRLARRGVEIYHCAHLHAKVLLIDDVAMIGSGNMSASSRDRLVEAAVMTDVPTAVSGVAAFIEQIRAQSRCLTRQDLARLSQIKVERRGFVPGRAPAAVKRPKLSIAENSTTWLVGVNESGVSLTESEQEEVDRIEKSLKKKYGRAAWICWPKSAPFLKRGRPGHQLIQICRPADKAPPKHVLRAAPVRNILRLEKKCFVFVTDPVGRGAKLSWKKFLALNRQLKGRKGSARTASAS